MLWSEEKKKKKKQTLFASNFALWFLSENCVCVCVRLKSLSLKADVSRLQWLRRKSVFFFSLAALTLKKTNIF